MTKHTLFHNLKAALCAAAVTLLACNVGQAQLRIDFNSTTQDGGPHNDTAGGFQAYDAGHEVAADFITKTYAVFGTNVTVTPDWTNTTDNNVRQMIDRGAGNDANWLDPTTNLATGNLGLDLVTDFIGIDARTANGGNGDWDGTTGTPTYMTVAVGGLAAGDYTWTSYHQDTENVFGTFAAWRSTDGGTNYTQLVDGIMTDSSPGGNPDSNNLVTTGAGMLAAGSIYNTTFTADGTNAVVMRFAPYAANAVHQQIWGMNGFSIAQAAAIPEPGSLVVLSLVGLVGLARRRR